LLFDVGPMAGTVVQPREMAFAIDKRDDRRHGSPELGEDFRTSDGVVVMDALAAGSGRIGNVYHGRFGEAGLTVSVDLALKSERSTVAKGQSIQKHSAALYRFFQGRGSEQPPSARAGGRKAGAAAANAAARAAAAAAAGELEDPHCWWCAVGRTRGWSAKDGHRYCAVCYSSCKDAPAAERPAAAVCDGCERCSMEAPPPRKRRKKLKWRHSSVGPQ
jgi:hypothetical protein